MSIKPFPLDITYAQYQAALSAVEGKEVALILPGPLLKWIGEAKAIFEEIANTVKASVSEIVGMFRHKDMFSLLKAVGFNLTKILKALAKVTTLVPRGLLAAMEQLAKSGLLEKLRAGLATIDDVLNAHPIIKQLAGVAVAGLLLWIWMNGAFIGDFKYDMDMSTVILAFKGQFTLQDLFLTPEGLAMLALFAVGTFTGLSFTWMAESTANLILAFCYTLASKMNRGQLKQKLKSVIEFKRY